mmetsp:Transcript_57672/g.106622  ORF Transcript_57672/g.106622 Transcript_57672/m.106622 type:complete len:201 (-) Transcript_57672:582-1184(-)
MSWSDITAGSEIARAKSTARMSTVGQPPSVCGANACFQAISNSLTGMPDKGSEVVRAASGPRTPSMAHVIQHSEVKFRNPQAWKQLAFHFSMESARVFRKHVSLIVRDCRTRQLHVPGCEPSLHMPSCSVENQFPPAFLIRFHRQQAHAGESGPHPTPNAGPQKKNISLKEHPASFSCKKWCSTHFKQPSLLSSSDPQER